MAGKPRPNPCYLDNFEVWKTVGGQKVWRNEEGSRLYTWDYRVDLILQSANFPD